MGMAGALPGGFLSVEAAIVLRWNLMDSLEVRQAPARGLRAVGTRGGGSQQSLAWGGAGRQGSRGTTLQRAHADGLGGNLPPAVLCCCSGMQGNS